MAEQDRSMHGHEVRWNLKSILVYSGVLTYAPSCDPLQLAAHLSRGTHDNAKTIRTQQRSNFKSHLAPPGPSAST